MTPGITSKCRPCYFNQSHTKTVIPSQKKGLTDQIISGRRFPLFSTYIEIIFKAFLTKHNGDGVTISKYISNTTINFLSLPPQAIALIGTKIRPSEDARSTI